MKYCRKKYGKKIASWHYDKKGKLICVTGGSGGGGAGGRAAFDAMSHQQKLDFYRKHFKGEGPLRLGVKNGKYYCFISH